MRVFNWEKIFLASSISLCLFLGLEAGAANVGDAVSFNVEKKFDSQARSKIQAELVKISNSLYFYIDKSWWDLQPQAERNNILFTLEKLSNEFDSNIYPKLTSIFGYEWKPGIDSDNRITVLFQPMSSAEGGYFRTTDEYDRLQLPESNQREMLYISLAYVSSEKAKEILAHEFMHLITFNQKNKAFQIEEDTWLNEARADYSSTLLGYDDIYQGSNLQQRVRDFAENPGDSVTEWLGSKYDYASARIFLHYVVDRYGEQVLVDSLKSKYIGIDSINYALQKMGANEHFAEIFSDWTVAVFLNNCSAARKYCYSDPRLKNFRISPSLNFLPMTGNVSMSVSNVTKSWAGNWLKLIGGNGDMELSFSSLKGLNFSVPYIIEDSAGSLAVRRINFDSSSNGEIKIDKFGSDYKSLVILPSFQPKNYEADGEEQAYPFTYKVQVSGSENSDEQEVIRQLLERIAELKEEIAKLQGKQPGGQDVCGEIKQNLSAGMSGGHVECLQQFLKSQGSEIYPEGMVTGYFGNLTKMAVIRFQQKYVAEILIPLGLNTATGYVGASTRLKINQLIKD